MEPFFYIPIFLFGLFIGSFLNCVIYRLEKNESFLKGRSYCPKCKHQLNWQDLIPLLSFIELRGRCRYCKQKISWQYPIVEISTAVIFLLIFNFQFFWIEQSSRLPVGLLFKQSLIFNFLSLFYYWITASFLIVVFIYDLKHYIIPDGIIYPAIFIAFLYDILYSYFILHNPNLIINFFYSSLGASLFFLIIFLVSRGKWLGFGDVKLAVFMGLFLGFPNILVSLFLAFFIGAIMGIGLILAKKKNLKSEVPFGPFLVTGTFIALFFGNQIISWYLVFLDLAP